MNEYEVIKIQIERNCAKWQWYIKVRAGYRIWPGRVYDTLEEAVTEAVAAANDEEWLKSRHSLLSGTQVRSQ